MYWVMASERSEVDEPTIEEIPPLFEQNDWYFNRGEQFLVPLPVIDIPHTINAKEKLTENILAPGCCGLLVHQNIKETLEALDLNNVFYYEARLINKNTGDTNEEYFIANIVGKIDCIDYDKSELEFRKNGNIRFIDKLVLKEYDKETYGYLNIFRLSAFLPIVIVDDTIKVALSKYSGFVMYKPEDYDL